MQKYTYVGAVDGILTLLDGVEWEVSRGETVEVSAEEAKRLDDQPDNWKKVAAPAATSNKDGDS